MKATLSILTFALIASVFTIKPSPRKTQFDDYSTQIKELNKVEKELKIIEKEVDNQIVNKALLYKKEITELQRKNISLKKNVIVRIDTIFLVDTIVTENRKSFKDTIK